MCDFATDVSPCGDSESNASDVVSLSTCTKSVHHHLLQHGLSSSKDWGKSSNITEYELILNRAGMFDVSPSACQEMKICGNHRSSLSTMWHGVRKRSCSFPDHHGKKNAMKSPRRVTMAMSLSLYSKSQLKLPIGSGKKTI